MLNSAMKNTRKVKNMLKPVPTVSTAGYFGYEVQNIKGICYNFGIKKAYFTARINNNKVVSFYHMITKSKYKKNLSILFINAVLGIQNKATIKEIKRV